MSGKPSDVLECLKQMSSGLRQTMPVPPWWGAEGSYAWVNLLEASITEIVRLRNLNQDLEVMKESYSRLYKQIYGND